MTRRSGSADLPLHGGRVPKWLGDRMTRLGAVIAEAIVSSMAATSCCRSSGITTALSAVLAAMPRVPAVMDLYVSADMGSDCSRAAMPGLAALKLPISATREVVAG